MRIKFSPTKVKSKDVVAVTLGSGQDTGVIQSLGGRRSLTIGFEKVTRRKFINLCRQVIMVAKSHRCKKLAVLARDFVFPHLGIPEAELGELMAVNFEMANFEFTKYKTRPKKGWPFVDEVTVVGKVSPEGRRGFARGQLIGRAINDCRILANTPGSDMTPSVLADAAVQAAVGTAIKVQVLRREQMEELHMGGVLGVAKGSAEEPRFIIMEYRGGGEEKPIVLVGKGVTFDTGGINLKPEHAMSDMHMDMSGGAAVMYAVSVAARLKVKKNIIGLIPAVENMPSGSSYRPGDMLKSLSGKTIEGLNTDAEGRIILADALTYARRYHPRLVVDVATLTGAAMVALGQRASALFSNDDQLLPVLQAMGEESGDYVWPLPLWEEYEEDIRGNLADIANVGKTRYGGAITGATFLHQFAKGLRWVHLDIAPRMTSIDGEHLAKGAAGAPIRLLLKLVERL